LHRTTLQTVLLPPLVAAERDARTWAYRDLHVRRASHRLFEEHQERRIDVDSCTRGTERESALRAARGAPRHLRGFRAQQAALHPRRGTRAARAQQWRCWRQGRESPKRPTPLLYAPCWVGHDREPPSGERRQRDTGCAANHRDRLLFGCVCGIRWHKAFVAECQVTPALLQNSTRYPGSY